MARVWVLVFYYTNWGRQGSRRIGAGIWISHRQCPAKNQNPNTGLRHHWGALSFGYFALGKQRKVTCCRATPDIKIQFALATPNHLSEEISCPSPSSCPSSINLYPSDLTPRINRSTLSCGMLSISRASAPKRKLLSTASG